MNLLLPQCKNAIVVLFITTLFVASCAKERTIRLSEENNPGLKANSTVADLMNRTSFNDGSKDNIIDRASCFSIKLPVTVIANGTTIVVETANDYEVIESIFDDSSSNVDTIEIIFPVTLIFSDFTEVTVNSQSELESYIDDDCNSGIDDDIECLDFQYPITASVFNTSNELLNTITISNDSEMHDFIEDLNDDVIVNINFPITITLFNGDDLVINNLNELETAINNAKDQCDEDDDNDFDDDDNTDMDAQGFSDLLTSCPWKVDELKVNEQEFENLKNTVLTFNADGTVSAELNSSTSSGTWTIITNDGLRLQLTMDTLTEFNNTWRLSKIEAEDDGKDKVELRKGEDELKIIKNCS
jgi:hypothetical protein